MYPPLPTPIFNLNGHQIDIDALIAAALTRIGAGASGTYGILNNSTGFVTSGTTEIGTYDSGFSNGTTTDASGGEITILTAGDYRVRYDLSAQLADDETVNGSIAVEVDDGSGWDQSSRTVMDATFSDDYKTIISREAILTLAAGDKLRLAVTTSGATFQVVFASGEFLVQRMS